MLRAAIIFLTMVLAPASQPAGDLAQGVQLMRGGQFEKARPILEKLYESTPPAQRSRPLVIDHAILDMTQKVYAARAVKDLMQYFASHSVNDEAATNVLGASLNIA